MKPISQQVHRALAALLMCGAALPAFADSLACQSNGAPLSFDPELTRVDLQYSSAGHPGHDGKLALFRLLASGESGEIQIKGDDVLKPGTYPLTTRAIWASTAQLDGHFRKVEGGELKVDAIRIEGDSGHVKGSTRFTVAGGASGRCDFDLPMFVMDRH